MIQNTYKTQEFGRESFSGLNLLFIFPTQASHSVTGTHSGLHVLILLAEPAV